MPLSKRAFEATVIDALQLMDQEHVEVADALMDGGYVLWIGAGVSRDRVPDLGKLVKKVLEGLRSRAFGEQPDARFEGAVIKALQVAGATDSELQETDLTKPIDTWPHLDQWVNKLTGEYSRFLDIRVPEHPKDYLVGDILDVGSTYGPYTSTPDVEHICLAILVLEGALNKIVSGNWDCLIEEAFEAISTGYSEHIRPAMTDSDLQGASNRAILYKFHGCARRVLEDNELRGMIIARKSQIDKYADNPDYANMRHQIVSAMAVNGTFSIGMSLQDADITSVFSNADSLTSKSWPTTPPPFVFCEDELNEHQENLLKMVFDDDYGDAEADILRASLIRVFAKKMLLAMVLRLLFRKVSRLVEWRLQSLDATEVEPLTESLLSVRETLAQAADSDPRGFVHRLLQLMTQGLAGFTGTFIPVALPDAELAAPYTYMAVSQKPLDSSVLDPQVANLGLPELGVALALVAQGVRQSAWTATVSEGVGPGSGSIEISAATGVSRLVFVQDATAEGRLEEGGPADLSDPELVMVHSRALAVERTRSPEERLGRGGTRASRRVSMSEICDAAVSVDDLMNRFRMAAVL